MKRAKSFAGCLVLLAAYSLFGFGFVWLLSGGPR